MTLDVKGLVIGKLLKSEDPPILVALYLCGVLQFKQLGHWVCTLTWVSVHGLSRAFIGLLQVTIVYAVTFPVNPVIFRLLRIGKMVRAVRMVAVTSFLVLQILFDAMKFMRSLFGRTERVSCRSNGISAAAR